MLVIGYGVIGKSHEASALHTELHAIRESWVWEKYSSLKKSTSIGSPMVSSGDIHTSNTILTEMVIFRNTSLCIYMYTCNSN